MLKNKLFCFLPNISLIFVYWCVSPRKRNSVQKDRINPSVFSVVMVYSNNFSVLTVLPHALTVWSITPPTALHREKLEKVYLKNLSCIAKRALGCICLACKTFGSASISISSKFLYKTFLVLSLKQSLIETFSASISAPYHGSGEEKHPAIMLCTHEK